MAEQLPIVAWRRFSHITGWNFWGDEEAAPGASTAEDLTPHAPAQSALDELRREVERLTQERDAAFAMSKCECSADEACANLAAARREVEALRADAERYRWLRAGVRGERDTSGVAYFQTRMVAPVLDNIMRGSVAQHYDAAIDTARASTDEGGGEVTTKYAKARDVAGQWKSELRKAQRENRSLRKVHAAARELLAVLACYTRPEGVYLRSQQLRVVLDAAVFAESPKEST